jgi:hypothetical protein
MAFPLKSIYILRTVPTVTSSKEISDRPKVRDPSALIEFGPRIGPNIIIGYAGGFLKSLHTGNWTRPDEMDRTLKATEHYSFIG